MKHFGKTSRTSTRRGKTSSTDSSKSSDKWTPDSPSSSAGSLKRSTISGKSRNGGQTLLLLLTTMHRPRTVPDPDTSTSTRTSLRPDRSTRWRLSPTTRPFQATTSKSQSNKNLRIFPSSDATADTPPSSKAGLSTQNGLASKWASTKTSSLSTAGSQQKPGEHRD